MRKSYSKVAIKPDLLDLPLLSQTAPQLTLPGILKVILLEQSGNN